MHALKSAGLSAMGRVLLPAAGGQQLAQLAAE